MRTPLRESEQHDLGMRADAHRRTPRSRAARRVHLHLAEALQSVGELAEGAPRDEVERKHLPAAMRVPRKLQAHPGVLGKRQAVGHMIEQNARRSTFQLQTLKK